MPSSSSTRRQKLELATLASREILRPGERLEGGGFRTERLSVDFLVNGTSLWQLLDDCQGFKTDLMGCMVAGYPDAIRKAHDRLSSYGMPDGGGGRVLLYICPECGDPGCGAYAVRIVRRGQLVVWRDFAFETAAGVHPIGGALQFTFDASAYDAVISAATEQLSRAAPRHLARKRARPKTQPSAAKKVATKARRKPSARG